MATARVFTAADVSLFALFICPVYRFRIHSSQVRRDAEATSLQNIDIDTSFSEASLQLRTRLPEALPKGIITPEFIAEYAMSMKAYWAQQACEVAPVCVVQSRDVGELQQAVSILASEYSRRKGHTKDDVEVTPNEGLFAIRSGGHSPVVGASSIEGGALIDLSLFNEVTPAQDRKSVVIGAGCK